MSSAAPPEGYTSRSPTAEDAEAVAELMGACQVADGDKREMTAEELLGDWERIDLGEEAVVVVSADGRIATSADVYNRSYVRVSVYGYVHPDHWGRGLGSYLVAWADVWTRERMDRAPSGSQVIVDHYMRSSNGTARSLMQAHGYGQVRTIYVMAVRLEGPPPPSEWPEGIAVRAFLPGKDEQAIFEAGEDAFRDSWGRPPGTYEGWIGPTKATGFDPTPLVPG
ncbi:MAG: GNAT family N-acetyltransferase [Chloroflexota bacterium]